jgi:hypothetical protein
MAIDWDNLPVYIYATDVAKRIGWNPRRVARLWRSQGIALRRGGRVVTTPEKLRGEYPEQWEAMLEKLDRSEPQ